MAQQHKKLGVKNIGQPELMYLPSLSTTKLLLFTKKIAFVSLKLAEPEAIL